MTPEELREKVARAIHATYCVNFGGTLEAATSIWNSMAEPSKQSWMRRADAALAVVREAMREPSEEMQRVSRMREVLPGGGAITMWATNRWAAMLAASPLAEPSP